MADGMSAAERRHNLMEEAKRRAAEKRGETYEPKPFSAVQAETPATPGAAVGEESKPEEPVAEVAGAVQSEPEATAEATAPPAATAQRPAPAGAKPEHGASAPKAVSTVASPATATPRSAPARPAAPTAAAEEGDAEGAGLRGVNRREFLMYSWGGALGLFGLATGVATFQFMYPRFREGEFGGDFPLGPASALPQEGASPQADTSGKFWLVNTADGPMALYMVCTHLGCLYKWEAANGRFECPCHGSKFTREGVYIEGPAPRSLDQFVIELRQGGSVIATTQEVDGNLVPPQVSDPGVEVVVKTGSKKTGKAHA